MRVLFTTNFPAPYRVEFFNELGKYCDLTVAYERTKAEHRDRKWVGSEAQYYREIFLNQKPIGTSQSIGFGIIKTILKGSFDRIILCGYASPSVFLSALMCKIRRIKYCLEFDGGFNKKDSPPKRVLKKIIFSGCDTFFITCKDTEEYLKSFGITKNRMSMYPFTSLHKSDILNEIVSKQEKKELKKKLGITEERVIISVGQFIYRKGFDILIKAANNLDPQIGIYIVGGNVTQEYLELCQQYGLKNIHFIPFLEKKELFDWYKGSDLFVLPTRSDIWGLVINEAMACGLPIVSSNMCISAKELMNDSIDNIYNCEDYVELSEKINCILNKDLDVLGRQSLNIISKYTIENMVKSHIEALKI